jgi:hypothetical protein
LLSIPSKSGEGYNALVAVDYLRLTPRSDFRLTPRLTLQDSTLASLHTFQAQVDMLEHYRTQKADLQIAAQYYRQDTYNAEYGIVDFNPVNPQSPDSVGSGYLITGDTRTSYHVAPSFSYAFTQRLSGEADVSATAVRYSIDVPGALVSFNSSFVDLNAVWAYSERTQLSAGPFFTIYDPTENNVQDNAVRSNTYGVDIGIRHRWTEETRSTLTARIGRDEFDQLDGTKRTGTQWGLEWGGVLKGRVSQISYRIGRFLEPSSVGSELALSQVRINYTRGLSARWQAVGSARLAYLDSLARNTGNRDRVYGQAFLRYALTQEWYLSGGYNFAWQNIPENPHATHSHGVFLTIGFQGLELHH